MARFPDEVVVALHEAGITLGCLPVRIDDGDWRAALFYVVPPDAPCRAGAGRSTSGSGTTLGGAPFAVELELELHEHAAATVVELGIEIRTPAAPLKGSVLFLTGNSSAHFDALTLLATQPDLPLFIGDEHCRLIAAQRVPLGDGERRAFRTLLDQAVGRDAVIRLSGHYDPMAAFDDVLRLTAGSPPDASSGSPSGTRHGPPPGPPGHTAR